MLRTRLIYKLGQRSNQGHSDRKWYAQDPFTQQILNTYLKEYRRYTPDSMKILETRSRSEGWYVTLLHPKSKMHPHTKFGIPKSYYIRDMLQT